MRSFYLIVLVVFVFLNTGCKKPKEDSDPDFDRKSMLTNIGNDIIIPSYETLKAAADKLDSATAAFNANPDLTNLANLQDIFKDVYRAWQLCSPFGFGPAEQEYLRNNMNTFPTTTATINSNISSGSYDLNAIANWSAKGLPAIDYLLFGTGADNNAILLQYTTDSEAANRKQYLADLAADIKTKVSTVLTAWQPSGGNYINTFINADGTDIGSSTGLLVNQVNYDFEQLKNYKLGTPLGKFSAGTQYPEKVEAYYSGISSELAQLYIQTIENIFLGKSSSGDGDGFDDYLNTLESQNGSALTSEIIAQLTSAIAALQAVPDPLSQTIVNNSSVVDTAYVEVQQLLVLLKAEMPSKLGILITYADNDGD